MEAAFAELPLALFTTLAPAGAGAFVALACAFFAASFTDEQLKKIDRMTFIPFVVVLVGFACSFAHLASPLNAVNALNGFGSSPLTNEIVVGSVFVVVALAYLIVALTGKLKGAPVKANDLRAGAAMIIAVPLKVETPVVRCACWTTISVVVEARVRPKMGGINTR